MCGTLHCVGVFTCLRSWMHSKFMNACFCVFDTCELSLGYFLVNANTSHMGISSTASLYLDTHTRTNTHIFASLHPLSSLLRLNLWLASTPLSSYTYPVPVVPLWYGRSKPFAFCTVGSATSGPRRPPFTNLPSASFT